MLSIKKIMLLAYSALVVTSTLQAQKVSISPSPDEIDLNGPATITIDVNACAANPLQGFAGEVYLWTWVYDTPTTNTNGSWNGSAAEMLMTPVSGQAGKYSFTFSPSVLAYYGITPAQLYASKGIGCLAKMKDGTGDMKTEDLTIKIAQPIVGKVLTGTLPAKIGDTVFVFNDDIVHFTYNNALDTLAYMHDPANPIGANDICVFTRAYFDDGSFLNYHISGGDPFYTLPSLTMKAQGDSEYRLSFIPTQFFTSSSCPNGAAMQAKFDAGKHLTKVTMRVNRKPYGGGTQPKPGPTTFDILLPKSW
jgi:hypothetical protein